MAAKNKARGTKFENRLVKIAREAGFESERMWGSDGRSRGYVEAVDVTIGDKKIQCKKRQKLAAYLQVPDGCQAVVFNQDRGPVMVLMLIDEYLDLLK